MSRAVLVALGLAAACGNSPTSTSTTTVGAPADPMKPIAPGEPAASEHPRLVVLLVLDQWPEWAFDVKRPSLHGGGFDRLLAEGEWHVGRHPSAATLTSPGHALLTSGQPTAASGILANEWWDRDVQRRIKSIEAEDGGTTATWMRVDGLGDALATAGTGAKAVSVSLKDRAAVLTLGHAGTPVWYDAKHAAWMSTARVAWLDEWNRSHPVSARLHEPWTALDPTKLASLSGVADNVKGELGEKGFGATFPHDPQATRDPADAVFAMPLGNELVLDTALAAIDGEQLGADDTPDLLIISLSAHDYVGHGWGHESWEMWDLEMRLDARLKDFLAALDKRVGEGRWSMLVTSDHGASPLPERMPRGGGRITFESIEKAANRAAIAELGDGEWVAMAKYPTLWLSKAALAVPKKDLDIAIRKMVYALRSFPGLERVERTDALAGHCDDRKPSDAVLCLSLDPERSGEIAFFPAPGWVLEEADELTATAHGSAHDYDRLVPVIELPPGRRTHASLVTHDAAPMEMTSVAGTLARWLGVAAPSTLPSR